MGALRSHQCSLDACAKHQGGEVVAVISGRSGLGKTNLALNLAILLAQRGQRVILGGADLARRTTAIPYYAAPPNDGAAAPDLRVGDCGRPRVSGDLRLAAGREWRSAAEAEQAVDWLRSACDTLVVACPAGLSATLVATVLASERVILMATPEPTALADSYATLKYLWQHGFAGRARLVVSLARSRREAENAARRLVRVARTFLGLSVEYLGFVPHDRHVPLAAGAQIPVTVRYPHCSASICIAQICTQVCPAVRAAVRAAPVWAKIATLFL